MTEDEGRTLALTLHSGVSAGVTNGRSELSSVVSCLRRRGPKGSSIVYRPPSSCLVSLPLGRGLQDSFQQLLRAKAGRRLPGWEILVGPEEAGDIPAYLKQVWT